MVTLESLWHLFSDWVLDAAHQQTFTAELTSDQEWNAALGTQSKTKSTQPRKVDAVSEVHRFLGSAATKRMDRWYKQLKAVMHRDKIRWEKSISATKKVARRASQTSKVAKAKIDLCKKVFCTHRELGKNLSEKYYNSTMKALNMGGLLLLRPKFFEWGQQTMQLIHASLNDRIINKLGDEAQKKAYDFVVKNQQLPKQFMHAVRAELGNSFDDDTITKVHNELLDFAFHGRSEVEWKKYHAATTDRSAGKEKKLQLREKLKATGCSS